MTQNTFNPAQPVEAFDVAQNLSYNWEYGTTRTRLTRLYENAKRDQWNSTERLDWTIDVDPESEVLPDMGIGIYGTPIWERLDTKQREELRHEALSWQLCQFLHGEQGALLATAQIVDAVPWFEGKMYGSTQVMDEARHVEVYRRFIQEKLGKEYPVNPSLKSLLDQILTDSRWDMKFLGMQIIVEGLALAAFGTIRDSTTNPLLRELTAGVMEDEARHVAFGVLSLREFCENLSEKERVEREDFVYEACVLMRDRITNREVWERVGLDPEECIAYSDESEIAKQFRYRLFSKIVPNVKSLGLLSDRQRVRFEELGILQYEGNTTSDVDQDMEEERRIRAGEIAAPVAA
ncbi:MAG: ferritin-like domain-containing protein [Deltaproteobacteria bacterium]|nr:ferritin-like domain-containing protein [Deltaproteobacteria bacterium]MBW2447869.1 ferritin-like domain-containing protein [Deltaproteobacteria bacterium]